ncbi:HAD-IIB family hydrolase [Volucribacter amazonae]|uniref:Hydrolase n=1 Tax=Volucribacter amazonae TaxID=256731 RepID=A0A9X4PLS1_9PAST|nr:HAD-IIB family hydrolase [Volucribacter amazonae]MDG6894113.1 hypothetical protein [Volucribacter amazonae]
MDKNIQHYIFDIDGTIALAGQKVAPEISNKIIKLAKQHQIIFASARPIRDMLPMLDSRLHQQSIFIGCNGAMAYHNGQFLHSNLLKKSDLHRILTQLKQHNIPYVLDGKWHFSLSTIPHPFHDYILSLSDQQQEEQQLITQGISKILVLNDKHIAQFQALNPQNLTIHRHKSEQFFDITPANNNKFYAIKQLISDQPYISFGNDENDFLTLDHAKVAIFVGDRKNYPQADYYIQPHEVMTLLDQFI